MGKLKLWVGTAPTKCNLCNADLGNWFADAKTAYGPWACMCRTCWYKQGAPFGLGLGQVWELRQRGPHQGKFVKTLG